MNMNEVIARINAWQKSKGRPSDGEEQAERDKLRRIYIDPSRPIWWGSWKNTYILQPDGTKRRPRRNNGYSFRK